MISHEYSLSGNFVRFLRTSGCLDRHHGCDRGSLVPLVRARRPCFLPGQLGPSRNLRFSCDASLRSQHAQHDKGGEERNETRQTIHDSSIETIEENDNGQKMVSEAERFVQDMLAEQAETSVGTGTQVSADELLQRRKDVLAQIEALQEEIDSVYYNAFHGIDLPDDVEIEDLPYDLGNLSESSFGDLGRRYPDVMTALLARKEEQDPQGWQYFQTSVNSLKLKRSGLEREASKLSVDAAAARRLEREKPSEYDESVAAAWKKTQERGGTGPSGDLGADSGGRLRRDTVRIVLITGFESFNVDLYKRAAVQLNRVCPNIFVQIFSDRDIEPRKSDVEAAINSADVFFGSLLFDFDQVEWLQSLIEKVPYRFVFESALELMSSTKVGDFQMAPSGKSAGPPPAVKKLLGLFGSGREEDRMVGYLSFLKIGPQLLKFLPGKKARELRIWLTVYSYWNQGGINNVVSMFEYIVRECFDLTVGKDSLKPSPVIETPQTGCLHPSAPGRFFSSPSEYMKWYDSEGPIRNTKTPTVALLLYRKHVITDQPYIPQLINELEQAGIRPLPIFINGVEAHTVLRDQLTTTHEQKLIAEGKHSSSSLRWNAVVIDAVINTIGFPLVGGPAGTMEGGRQSDIAKAILSTKNVPYVVAAPLLIQDLQSWISDGIGGLQSVVLYSLPELDGAIDTVPLGGLVGDNIFLIPERVRRLAARLTQWINLRRTPPSDRKVAIILYGFPPGVGSAGTAALLNVPRSLEALLHAMREEGYDLGNLSSEVNGEDLIGALRDQLSSEPVVARGAKGAMEAGPGPAGMHGAEVEAADISPADLKSMLRFPSEWGPTEWGPIPFLPEPDVLVRRMENQWGELGKFRAGLSTSAAGDAVVVGLRFGNVFLCVQPLLGLEGDPMRLLFERDLTPHPQYAAFYRWIQESFEANALVHFGMHGTVEWLPGAPLGNSGFSWSDVLLGNLPNIYVYAANNPSESIIAKRRGYGTMISHNVPPYGRAGLYKQLAELKAVLAEFRESPETSDALKPSIADLSTAAGLQADCPYWEGEEKEIKEITEENVDEVNAEDFESWVSRLYMYLQEVETRLYSEGLHILGSPPTSEQSMQYLSAYFGDTLPTSALEAIASSPSGETVSHKYMEEARAALERAYEASADVSSNLSSGVTRLQEAARIKSLLDMNTEEIAGVLKALNGEYILPEAGGDLLRDGASVLPTGRNIHALDPYRMPSAAAMSRGANAAQAILETHLQANDGVLPETVAVNLWGLDAIKTKGESVGIVLSLIGAKPVKEGTGRIARFELIPLEELGRPRIDVLCNLSGIFRDSFQNVVELLDDVFQKAATADEPEEKNFIKKHARAMLASGQAGSQASAAARLFSNPPGDYGSMVNERVGAGNWDDGDELGSTWASRNAYSYGRGSEKGAARPEVLKELLKTTDRIVQEVDSVEYGLTDIQEYYANTGALRRAAQSAKGENARPVGCSIVEAFSKKVKPKELEEVLRLEYRSKLLNPKWAEAMAANGSGGAFEISQRMTAMLGWGATVDYKEHWTWEQAADTYAFDEEMASKLRESNPQAFANVVRRMLEAAGRGMWTPTEEDLERLKTLYSEMDEQLEGVV